MGHFGIRTRKSAFFLSFSITTMALCVLFGSLLLFWQGAEEKTVGNPQSVAMENPDERLLADRRENLLCTVWDGDTPLLVTVLGLYPEARSITVFCLPMGLATSVAGEPMTLGELYGYGGKQLQKEAVEEATGLIVSRQVSMDVNGVRSLVDATGALRYSVAIGTSAEHITITPGDKVLDGSKVYAYLKGLAELPEERAEEALEEQSRLVQELIRQNFTEYNTQRTLGLYDEMLPVMETDLTLKDMVGYAPVLQELSKEFTVNIFFPQGSSGEEGIVLTQECRERIQSYFALTSGS